MTTGMSNYQTKKTTILTLWCPLLPYGHNRHSDTQPWASECRDVKN